MLVQNINLTTALRPLLLPDETLLFVQDSVGLYQGNLKIPAYQNGQVYLTSHRACYIDSDEPRAKAVAVDLKDVERCELYAGFLKSSAKVTFYPKAAKQFGLTPKPSSKTDSLPDASHFPRQNSPRPLPFGTNLAAKPNNSTWICPICSFSNAVPVNFDPATANANTPLQSCMSCGIKPPLLHVVKAAIAGIANRPSAALKDTIAPSTTYPDHGSLNQRDRGNVRCSRCTFENHSSMLSCEVCGASLVQSLPIQSIRQETARAHSPGPTLSNFAHNLDPFESIRFSFRSGGEKIFLERANTALVQKKWVLHNAPTTPILGLASSQAPESEARRNIGITGLERRDRQLRKNNEVVIGNAFEDLSALMASAKEIIALAEKFSPRTGSQQSLGTGDADTNVLLSSLNLTTTKEMLGNYSNAGSNSTYITQLSRQVAEFLTDDSSGTALLKSSGGIISLVDLWSVFNRARGGVELVSPNDFSEAVAMFDKLNMQVRLRVFGSGLKAVRSAEWSDERIVKALLTWLEDRRLAHQISDGLNNNQINWGQGVTALEVADRFGWSLGVATEELTMAEEKGAVCREIGVEGIRFWENWFVHDIAGSKS